MSNGSGTKRRSIPGLEWLPEWIQDFEQPLPGAEWLRDQVRPGSVMDPWAEKQARDFLRALVPQTPRDAALEAAIGMIAGPVIGKAGRAVSRKLNPPFNPSRRAVIEDVSGGDLMNQIRSRDAMLGDWAEAPDFTTYQNPHMLDEILTESGRRPIGPGVQGQNRRYPLWSDKDLADAKKVADSMGMGAPGLDNKGFPKNLLSEVSYGKDISGGDLRDKMITRPYERSGATPGFSWNRLTDRERMKQQSAAFGARKDKAGTYWYPHTKPSGLSAKHLGSSPKMTGTNLPEYTEAGKFSSPTLRRSVTKGMDTLSTKPEHGGILEEFFNVLNKRIGKEVLEETGEEVLKGSEGEITEKALDSILRRFGVRK